MKLASYSCCIFLCIVLAVTCSKYRRYHLLCLPFVWHFLFNVAHTHFSFFLFCNVGSDRLMKRGSLFLQYFSLQRACCYLKYCRYRLSCLLFIRHFLFIVTHSHTRVRAHTHTHTHTHTRAHTHTRTHARAHTRTRAHTHARARAHTHTHTHTHIVHAGWVVFVFFIFIFSIHVGHDHGLVRCIVFAHVFVNVPV